MKSDDIMPATDNVAGVSGASELIDARALKRSCQAFQQPSMAVGLWQVASTSLLLVALLIAMYRLLPLSLWAAWVLALPAAGCVVRLFIIQHDCGHGAFFRSRRLNDLLGNVRCRQRRDHPSGGARDVGRRRLVGQGRGTTP